MDADYTENSRRVKIRRAHAVSEVNSADVRVIWVERQQVVNRRSGRSAAPFYSSFLRVVLRQRELHIDGLAGFDLESFFGVAQGLAAGFGPVFAGLEVLAELAFLVGGEGGDGEAVGGLFAFGVFADGRAVENFFDADFLI